MFPIRQTKLWMATLFLGAGVASAQPLPADDAVPKPLPAPVPPKPRVQFEQIIELQKELSEAMRGGDQQKIKELVTKMRELMRPAGGGDFPMGAFAFPGGREQPKSDLRIQYEQQLKEFANSIEKLRDDKDGREGIEKARDEYKKAMEPELKKADDARPALPPQRMVPQFQLQGLEAFPFAGGDLFMPGLDMGFRNPRLNSVQLRLGVKLEKPSTTLVDQLELPANVGIVVLDVMRGMPAEKSGLKPNDILLQWAGKDVQSNVEEFQQMIATAKGGEKIDAVVLRKGKKVTVNGIELPEVKKIVPPAPALNQVSIQIDNTSAEIRATTDGVRYEITGVTEGETVTPSKIVIVDGDETLKFETIAKVPEKYKATVEGLVKLRGNE